MSYFTFHDISYAQGRYNMDADPSPVVEMKMSGFYYGSKTPYMDVQATNNYNNATRLGKVPICYHFAGGADPVAEAEYFVKACSPLADGDIYELDYELNADMNPPADPDSWCRAFADQVKELTGAYPLLYTYTSLLREHGFSKTLEVCGLIQANYAVSPDDTIPGPSYIIQQFTDKPIDTNACFISLETLKKYARGYNAPQPISEPVPQPVTPTPEVPVTPASPPPLTATSNSGTTTTYTYIPPALQPQPKQSFWAKLLALLAKWFIGKKG